jgi:xanthine dehydrogenase accessory factor
MLDTQLEVLQGVSAALAEGHQVTLVSVVKTWGNSPRPVGALLAVANDGRFWGSVSGGCVEDDLLSRLVQQPVTKHELTVYGETDAERQRLGLPCGGTLELLLEPLQKLEDVTVICEAIRQRQLLLRHTCIETGEVTLEPLSVDSDSDSDVSPKLENNQWTNIFGPSWRLLIIGAGQTSRYLAEMAQALGYCISISDPRPEYRQGWDVSGTELLAGYPDDVVDAFKPDARTAIVALTHDPRLDDAALMSALNSDAFYVGALGSVRTNANRRQRFAEHFDFGEKTLSKLHGPVGLPIGSKTPPEIALAILAELTALRNGVDVKARLQSAL